MAEEIRAFEELGWRQRAPLCCDRCRMVLGEKIETDGEPLFLAVNKGRVELGRVPNFILCDIPRCGGWWKNPDWSVPPTLVPLLPRFRQAILALPRIAWPARIVEPHT